MSAKFRLLLISTLGSAAAAIAATVAALSSGILVLERGAIGGNGRMKLNGAQTRPSKSARLKFSVASMEIAALRSSSENDCRIWISLMRAVVASVLAR